ncbi:MAG: SIS domain-containing protein [Bacteroidales bacterium]|nr:SIS domain-containing protein [Bacteroidales bacterium]
MIEKKIIESIEVKQLLLKDKAAIEAINVAANKIISCFGDGKSVWLCGNGGSAADAQHIAAELSGRFYFNRPPLPAEAFSVNTSYITAVANDFGFEYVFKRLADAHCRKGDVLIGISTSGNSKNIIKAIEAAKDNGTFTIALTGNKGGLISEIADISIIAPSADTPRIQETHILIGHIICEIVETEIFGNKK